MDNNTSNNMSIINSTHHHKIINIKIINMENYSILNRLFLYE